jgi:hypothetical protein
MKDKRLRYSLMKLILTFLIAFWTASASAQGSRYELDGNTLNFDMRIEDPKYEFSGQLEMYDSNEIAAFLFDYPEIKTLRITGPGGFAPAAREIADKLIRFEIDTVAFGECNSACATIFLAGKNRILEPNSTIGFHRQWIDKPREKKYYEAMRETKGWKDEFDYLAWVYDVLVDNLVKDIQFMESRGVNLDFISETLETKSYDMWRPTRKELLAGGVITH